MLHGRPPSIVVLRFPMPGYCKVKGEDTSQANAQVCFTVLLLRTTFETLYE